MLTGKTRFRSVVLSGWRSGKLVLLLQVEERNPIFSSTPTLWRDATTEDLAELSFMRANAPWNAEQRP